MSRWFAVSLLVSGSALACGWDYETLIAETGSLPCVEAVAVMRPAKHSPLLLERRLDVADLALALVPGSLAAHDARTNALLHLGKLELAVQSARARAALAPDDYGSHANLATVLTFTGDLDGALAEVKATLAKDPEAHFGREKFHLQFVEFLLALKKDPDVALQRDFLGLSLTEADALSGNAAKIPPGALEALQSMLGVYGGAENPHLLFALGDVLALRGERKLAFAAWMSALQKKHPARAVALPWMEKINAAAHDEWLKGKSRDELHEPGETRSADPLNRTHWLLDDQWVGLAWSADKRRELWEGRVAVLARQEEELLRMGTAVWTEAGLSAVITAQRRLGLRCSSSLPSASGLSPGMFDVVQADNASPEGLAWLGALEEVVAEVLDARSCEVVRPALTARLEKMVLPMASLAARRSVLADSRARERFLDVFDRLALVLSKCPPKGKGGNSSVLARWVPRLEVAR